MTTVFTHADGVVTFSPHAPGVARLACVRGSRPFGRDFRPGPRTHRLGFLDAPLYELTQSFTPDDAWGVRLLPDGRSVGRPERPGGIRDLGSLIAAPPTQLKDLLAVAEVLPVGGYLVVVTYLAATAPPEVVLGNELAPRPDNVSLLFDSPPYYALCANSQPAPLRADADVLLGQVVLNYAGQPDMHGVIFCSYLEPPARPPTTGPKVLIIPAHGEFVLDNMGAYPHVREVERLTEWKRNSGEELAKRFAAG